MRLPSTGTRVSLRYRSPAGADKPLTDVVGYLETVGPEVVVRTKAGELVHIADGDILSARELSHRPVRSSEIRGLEHAAASAWPGVEQRWLDGWLLRAGHGISRRANSAVPLDISADLRALPDLVEWYRARGLPAVLALPERLLPVRGAGVATTRLMVADIVVRDAGERGGVALSAVPDAQWLADYARDVPVDVLTAVVDGDVVFAAIPGTAVGRATVTSAPDGTRWLGISAIRVTPGQRRRGCAGGLGDALFDWGVRQSAQRAYVEVPEENGAARAFVESMGFRLHHTKRYVQAESLLAPRI